MGRLGTSAEGEQRAWIEVRLDHDPIDGELHQRAEEVHGFQGWLGLLEALERARERARRTESSDGKDRPGTG